MNILLTGASGFVGRAMLDRLRSDGHQVVATSRHAQRDAERVRWLQFDEIGPETDWHAALAGIDCVIHLAARVHQLDDRTTDPLQDYLRCNSEGTRRLADCAARAGVRHFVFLSSIKVNGERTPTGRPFVDTDPPAPEDAYAVSKLQAEQALIEIAAGSGLCYTILRPPLLYGPDVKANMLRLLGWVSRGLPLPLAGIENRRSLLYVDNLCDLIAVCLDHPDARNRTFLVCDGDDLSTPELVTRLGRFLARPARLLPARMFPLRMLARLFGRGAELERLTDSLQIDLGTVTGTLDWHPPYAVDDGLRATCDWYNARHSGHP